MTDVPDDEDAAGTEGECLTGEQVAQARAVTPAAVRAQLRAGNLAGEQVLRGQRTVWRIPVSAARRYLAGAEDAVPPPAASRRVEAPARPPAQARPPAPVAAAEPEPALPAAERNAPGRPAPMPAGQLEALESEVRRLRRQLSALADAHRRLLDVVTVDLTDEI